MTIMPHSDGGAPMTPKEEIKAILEEQHAELSPTLFWTRNELRRALSLLDKVDDRVEEVVQWSRTYRDTARAQRDRWDRIKDSECYYYHEGRREQAQAFIDVWGKEPERTTTLTAREWHDYE